MKLTRRQMASTLTAGAALAQAPSQPPPTADADLQAARDRVKANAARLSAQAVPMGVEPAFQFKP
jgi:hypothetical protein